MSKTLERLDRERIWAGLTPAARAQISRLEVFTTLDSTNRYLLHRAQEGWERGAICLAEQQTAGRGRQGRRWLTPAGTGLAYSLLWRFTEVPETLSGLSLASGLTVARVLKRLGIDGIGLKWPNDVWWQERKLAGILLESGGQANNFYVVAGIGLNIALPREEAAIIEQPWVDLQAILAMALPSRNALAAALISELVETFDTFARGGPPAEWVAEWAQFDAVAGRQVNLLLPNGTITGIARGVDHNGALILETAEGRKQTYLGGEIQLRVHS